MILLIAILLTVTSVSSESRLTAAKLREICPNDKPLCAAKVAKGECFGTSLKAGVLQRQCQCSCDAIHYHRIQDCCITVGEQEMKFCMPLCRYNTTGEELGSTLGLKCLSQLTTWAYCASDAQDLSDCCTRRGVPSECQSFCKGDVPTCDTQSIFNYQGCIQYMGSIMSCQRAGLVSQPRFDTNWSSECDWQGK